MVNIVFFGTASYSLVVLKALQKQGYLIKAVVTQTQKPQTTPVCQFAQKYHLPILKNQAEQTIMAYQPDLLVVACYGFKIPADLIAKVRFGGLNVHPSLLPKYRGPAPAEWAILNAEEKTGVTIVTLAQAFDSGLIVAQSQAKILPTDTAESLYFRLFNQGANVLTTILPSFLEGRLKLKKQDETKASYAPKLKRQDGEINWRKPPDFIERQIRAFYPWPGTFTWVKIKPHLPAKRLKILRAHLENNRLILDQVQLEGKNPVSFKQFCEGYPQYQFLR